MFTYSWRHKIEEAVVRHLSRVGTSPSDGRVRTLYFEAHPRISSADVDQDDVEAWANDCIDRLDARRAVHGHAT